MTKNIANLKLAVEANLDIHVLAGQQTRTLNDLLFIYDTANPAGILATSYLPHPTISLAFRALCQGTPSTIDSLNPTTGQIKIAATLPTPRKHNFLLEITVTDSADGSSASEIVRVHVHQSVKSLALTPTDLTVRPSVALRPANESTTYRFTARATFDDDTMGDVTTGHGLTWSATSANVDGTGRFFFTPASATGDTITVTATLPATLGGASAQAKFHVSLPWSEEPSMPQAGIVPGGGWPGTTLPDQAPNILLMGDGFEGTNQDKDAFQKITTTMVHFMKTDKVVRPFDLLCTSMNFWRVMVPTIQRGISFRCEVYPLDAQRAWPVPRPVKPPATGSWDIRHLVYAVGLPVPADLAKAAGDLRAEWTALTPIPPSAATASDDLIAAWKKLGKRGFIDELDAFPGMSYGQPPAANLDSDTPMLDLHSDRAGRAGMTSFFNTLASDNGVKVGTASLGTVWAQPPLRINSTAYNVGDVVGVVKVVIRTTRMFVCTAAGTTAASEPAQYAAAEYGDKVTDGSAVFTLRFPFDNTDLIVMMSVQRGGRAMNATGYIALSTEDDWKGIAATAVSGGSNFIAKLDAAPTDATPDTSRTAAHELAHSFGLQDEYVDFENDYPFSTADLSNDANVQRLDDVVSGTPKRIDGKLIRWNWLRVRKAAVITGPPTASSLPNCFSVPVVPGHGLQFKTDDIVLLRLRKPGVVLDFPAKVVELHHPLRVIMRGADVIVVAGEIDSTITLADLVAFPPGSTLFMPVPMPAGMPGPTEPFARMVAKNVENLITSTHNPLYTRPTGTGLTDEVKHNQEIQHPALGGLTPNVPGRPFCFKAKPSIVGLYEGGARYATKIYHPTGASCMMRDDHEEGAPFCPVCRYIMVELINPFCHFEIDQDYDDIYPLR